jgi:hypothetical protein
MQRTDRGTDRVVDLRPVADLLAHTVGGTVDDLFAGRRQVVGGPINYSDADADELVPQLRQLAAFIQ